LEQTHQRYQQKLVKYEQEKQLLEHHLKKYQGLYEETIDKYQQSVHTCKQQQIQLQDIKLKT